jgi:hypothetical protein
MASRRRSSRKTITGNISDVQRRLKFLEGKPSPSRIGNQAVLRGNIQPRAVATDQLALNAVVNSTIEDNAVNAAKLAADSVGNSELDANAVDSENYIDGSIDTEHYGVGSVDINAIGVNAVGNGEMTDNSVDSAEYIDNSIDSEHYSIGSVDNNAVGLNAIQNGEMADNSIDSTEYIDFSIDAEHYSSGSVNAAAIGLNAVENGEMADNSVDSAEYIDRSIDSEHYASGSVDATAIGLDAIGSSELGNNSVDTNAIVGDSVTSAKIAANQISGSKGTKNHIADNSIGQLNIGPLAVGTGELIDRAVTQVKIATNVSFPPADGSVTTAKIANQNVTTAKIADNAIISLKIGDEAVGSRNVASISAAAITAKGFLSVVAGTVSIANRGTPLAFLNLNRGNSAGEIPPGNHTHPGNNQPPASSIRFKKDIADYEVDGTKLLNLQAKTFKYKAGHRDQQYGETYNRPWVLGFMAEEVLEAGIEEVIWYDNEGLPASLRYDLLSVYVIDLLKKHQNEIDFLKEEIQKINDRLSKISENSNSNEKIGQLEEELDNELRKEDIMCVGCSKMCFGLWNLC